VATYRYGDTSRKDHSTPTPRFFVSVASKGLSHTVSPLFATLAGRSISVAAKGFTGEFSDVWQGKDLGKRGG
jgi:hypothetical protein